MTAMKQTSLDLDLSTRKTRKAQFLAEMNAVIPWQRLVDLIKPKYSSGKFGRPPFELEVMLRIHCLQQFYNLADAAMEEELFNTPLFRSFAQLEGMARVPDETTIMRFRHLLEEHQFAPMVLEAVNDELMRAGLKMSKGTIVDATMIASTPSTKNSNRARDPEMHQAKKGNQWYHGMKKHIGVDAESGIVHSVAHTAANVHDLDVAHGLVREDDELVFADAGYRGASKREEIAKKGAEWMIAKGYKERQLIEETGEDFEKTLLEIEPIKASIRAKVEHVFRVIKCQFGYRKTRYRGIQKNASQQTFLAALANIYMKRNFMLKRSIG
jgi:IS5 family transposase